MSEASFARLRRITVKFTHRNSASRHEWSPSLSRFKPPSTLTSWSNSLTATPHHGKMVTSSRRVTVKFTHRYSASRSNSLTATPHHGQIHSPLRRINGQIPLPLLRITGAFRPFHTQFFFRSRLAPLTFFVLSNIHRSGRPYQ